MISVIPKYRCAAPSSYAGPAVRAARREANRSVPVRQRYQGVNFLHLTFHLQDHGAVAREEPRVLVRLVSSGGSRSVHLLELDKVVSQFIAKGRDLGLGPRDELVSKNLMLSGHDSFSQKGSQGRRAGATQGEAYLWERTASSWRSWRIQVS